MKFLLLFFIILLIAFQWRQARKPKVDQVKQKGKPGAGALSMVKCAQCGLHLPEAEAVKGARAMYCSTAHRQALEP